MQGPITDSAVTIAGNHIPPPPPRGFRFSHGDRPLDGYTIIRGAGRGGFGEVYYAVSDSGREVALKIVQAYENVELRGISQCMNLKSPQLVTVFDVKYGQDGLPCVIMEFVKGPSLREILDQSPSGIGTQKSAFFLREIGKGLTFLHDCGIVHRDLKPGNIFYENGIVKIGDYGLSKAISPDHRSGQTVTVGTLHYMAPEIGEGRYDLSIDIYAMGALLYEMLTGQVPFFGASPAEVLMKHMTAHVDVSGIEEPFATVIRRALAKNPTERYRTIQEMVEAVYGEEHIRQSVSCFSPDSLTLVAGRIARHALQSPPSSSVTAPGSNSASWADRLGKRIAGIGNRVSTIGGKAAGVGRRLASRILPHRAGVPVPPPPPVEQPADPLTHWQRIVLCFSAVLIIGIAAAMVSPREVNDPGTTFYILFASFGAGLGTLFAGKTVGKGVASESWPIQRLAFGGLTCIGALVLTLPFSIRMLNVTRHGGETFGAICITLFILDWSQRIDPNRSERLVPGDLITGSIVGLIVSSLCGAYFPIVIGIACGACIVAQLMSPWRRGAEVESAEPEPPPPPQEQAMIAPAPTFESPPPAPIRAVAAPREPVKIVEPIIRKSGSFIAGSFRFLIGAVATSMMLGAIAASVFYAADIPGLMASGRIDPRLPEEMTRDFGTSSWPKILQVIAVASMFTLTVLAQTLFMMLRRRHGGIHMLRSLLGSALLVAAPMVLVSGAPQPLAPPATTPTTTESRFSRHNDNPWPIIESYTRNIVPSAAMRSGIVFISGLMLVLWPAKKERPKSKEELQHA